MKLFVLAMLLPTVALAGECVMQSKVASQSRAVVQERSAVTRIVTPELGGQRRCIVSYRARVNDQWLTAHGEHTFTDSQSEQQACQIALHRADSEVITRPAHQALVATDSVVVCSDRPQHQALKHTQVGTVGAAGQFRIHPERPRDFVYNGARCRWFVDTEFAGQDITRVQGVICHLKDQNWVVVDKF